MKSLNLLHVEDSQSDSDLILLHLRKGGIEPVYERVETGESFRGALMKGPWDAVVCDYNLPRFNAFEALKILKDFDSNIPFIIVSGSIGEEKAVEAMRAGASDYVMKDNLHRFIPALQRAIQEFEAIKESRRVEEALKTSEENLRKAQKLESIGLLAGGIAHDFNNVLAEIILQSEMMTLRLSPDTTPENLVGQVGIGLEEIRKSAQRACGLTRKLLAFGRRQVVNDVVLNLNPLVEDMREMLQRIVEENIEFNTVLSAPLKNVNVDSGHIEQVILNLVVNARDAMPNGGRMTIETKNQIFDGESAQITGLLPGAYVMLSVTDSGTGMSEEVKKNIFEPFFTTKPVGKGTGLGLSTVYGIVKQCKGYIFVESSPGKGTCFRLFFPATDKSVQLQKPSSSKTVKLTGTETLLVVEDEPVLRGLIGDILEKNGYKVLKAVNGEEALEVIKSNADIRLIISDIVMPKMGGIELGRKAMDYNKNLKFLFQSGYMSDTLNEAGISSGYYRFIQKPYLPEVLLAEIREILN